MAEDLEQRRADARDLIREVFEWCKPMYMTKGKIAEAIVIEENLTAFINQASREELFALELAIVTECQQMITRVERLARFERDRI